MALTILSEGAADHHGHRQIDDVALVDDS